jgi:hypothetical protein
MAAAGGGVIPPPRASTPSPVLPRSVVRKTKQLCAAPAPANAAAGAAALRSHAAATLRLYAWPDSGSAHTYEYYISRPVDTRANFGPRPLLLLLHGSGRERGALPVGAPRSRVTSLRFWGANSILRAAAPVGSFRGRSAEEQDCVESRALLRERFVVVTPQHPSRPCVWDIEAVQRLACHLVAVWPTLIDPTQLFLAGVSMGGSAAWDVAIAQAMASPLAASGGGKAAATPRASRSQGGANGGASGGANPKGKRSGAPTPPLAGIFAAFVSVAGFVSDNAKATTLWPSPPTSRTRIGEEFPSLDGSRPFGTCPPALLRTPIWAAHGSRDDVVSVLESVLPATSLQLGGNRRMRLHVLDGQTHFGAHGAADAALSNPALYTWLLAQRRGAPPLMAPLSNPFLAVVAGASPQVGAHGAALRGGGGGGAATKRGGNSADPGADPKADPNADPNADDPNAGAASGAAAVLPLPPPPPPARSGAWEFLGPDHKWQGFLPRDNAAMEAMWARTVVRGAQPQGVVLANAWGRFDVHPDPNDPSGWLQVNLATRTQRQVRRCAKS